MLTSTWGSSKAQQINTASPSLILTCAPSKWPAVHGQGVKTTSSVTWPKMVNCQTPMRTVPSAIASARLSFLWPQSNRFATTSEHVLAARPRTMWARTMKRHETSKIFFASTFTGTRPRRVGSMLVRNVRKGDAVGDHSQGKTAFSRRSQLDFGITLPEPLRIRLTVATIPRSAIDDGYQRRKSRDERRGYNVTRPGSADYLKMDLANIAKACPVLAAVTSQISSNTLLA